MDNQQLDTNVPNAGRVYDYVLGGSHNFEADRNAAEYMISLIPSTRKWVRMLRQFLQEATLQLAEEGFDKFLDLGSGLPTAEHIHSLVPDARVVYVDMDPVTVLYGTELLGGTNNARYVQADVRDIKDILQHSTIQEMFGDDRKVVIVLNAMLCFFTEDEVKHMVQTLYDWAAPGSKLFATFECKNPALTTPNIEAFIGMFNQMGAYYEFSTPEQSLELMKPWHPDGRGLRPLSAWLDVAEHFNDADREGVELEFYGAIFEK